MTAPLRRLNRPSVHVGRFTLLMNREISNLPLTKPARKQIALAFKTRDLGCIGTKRTTHLRHTVVGTNPRASLTKIDVVGSSSSASHATTVPPSKGTCASPSHLESDTDPELYLSGCAE